MILLSQRHSPFACKAEVAILETGLSTIEIRHEALNMASSQENPREVNPLNRIPALIFPEGRAVFDSEDICFFIDEFAKGALIPKDGVARQEALSRQTLATGLCETGADLRWELEQSSDGISFPGLREDMIAQLSAAYEILESSPAPDQIADIGTIALATALDWMAFRALDIHMPPHPNITQWLDEFRQRPSMTATVYEDLANF